MSDPVSLRDLPTLEQRMDDVRAVMDAAGSERAALLGISEGGPLCALFAATYPERTLALVLAGCYSRLCWAPDHPWGRTPEVMARNEEEIRQGWGGPVGLERRAPSVANDPAFSAWWAKYLRMSVSVGAALTLGKMNASIDARHVLPAGMPSNAATGTGSGWWPGGTTSSIPTFSNPLLSTVGAKPSAPRTTLGRSSKPAWLSAIAAARNPPPSHRSRRSCA